MASPAIAPTAPTHLRATPLPPGGVSLSWRGAREAAGYVVRVGGKSYRTTSSSLVLLGVLPGGRTYSWTVDAVYGDAARASSTAASLHVPLALSTVTPSCTSPGGDRSPGRHWGDFANPVLLEVLRPREQLQPARRRWTPAIQPLVFGRDHAESSQQRNLLLLAGTSGPHRILVARGSQQSGLPQKLDPVGAFPNHMTGKGWRQVVRCTMDRAPGMQTSVAP